MNMIRVRVRFRFRFRFRFRVRVKFGCGDDKTTAIAGIREATLLHNALTD